MKLHAGQKLHGMAKGGMSDKDRILLLEAKLAGEGMKIRRLTDQLRAAWGGDENEAPSPPAAAPVPLTPGVVLHPGSNDGGAALASARAQLEAAQRDRDAASAARDMARVGRSRAEAQAAEAVAGRDAAEQAAAAGHEQKRAQPSCSPARPRRRAPPGRI